MHRLMFALALVGMMACGAVAEEVSQGTLGDMGLTGMQSMSDDQGMAVRGKWAIVGGLGTAAVIGETQETTFYLAGTDPGDTGAAGANIAVAATIGVIGGTGSGGWWFVLGAAQGSLAAGGSIAGTF